MGTVEVSADDMKQVRKYVYDTFVVTAHAPVVEQIINQFGMTRNTVMKTLKELESRHMLVLQQSSNKILMLHPFSNIPTCWVVKPNDHIAYYANCAWDAIAMHFSLHHAVSIESYCQYCNAEVKLKLSEEVITSKLPPTTLIGVSRPVWQWWNNIVDTCGNHMNFYCSLEHFEAWKLDHGLEDDQMMVFTDKIVLGLSDFLYSHKSDLEYRRPTDEEEIKAFADLDLTGKFWDISTS